MNIYLLLQIFLLKYFLRTSFKKEISSLDVLKTNNITIGTGNVCLLLFDVKWEKLKINIQVAYYTFDFWPQATHHNTTHMAPHLGDTQYPQQVSNPFVSLVHVTIIFFLL